MVLLTARDGFTAVAVVLLAGTVPRLLGPVGGALADRMGRRSLMRGCLLAQAAAIGLIAATLPPLPVLAALVAASALFATAFGPASSSSVPGLVPAADLRRANALIGTALNVQIAIGPAVGGLLVGLGGARSAFAVDTGSFLVAALLLGRLPALPPGAASGGGIWSDTRAGLAYVRHSAPVAALVLGTLVFLAFAAIDNVALVFLVEDRLGGSATAYGLVQAAFGVGMLVASGVLVGVSRQLGEGRLLLGGGAATIAGSLATAAAPGLLVGAGAQALAGVGNGLEEVATSTYVQRLVPAPMLGRVFGVVATTAQLGSGLAYVAGAPLVAVAGPRTAFVVAGVGAAVGILVLLPAVRAAGTVGQPGSPG